MRHYTSPNRRHDRRFFYKYVAACTARIVLASRKLRWSSPVLFNDPFDNHPDALHFDGVELQRALIEDISSLPRIQRLLFQGARAFCCILWLEVRQR